MGGLQCRFAEDDAVVGDNADQMAPDPGEAAHDRLAPLGFEGGETTAIHNASDDLGRIEWNSIIGTDNAVDLFGWVRRRFRLDPIEPSIALIDTPLVRGLTDFAKFAIRLAFARRHVITHPADASVKHCTAQVVWFDDLAERRFDDWRAAQENSTDALDHDHFVA